MDNLRHRTVDRMQIGVISYTSMQNTEFFSVLFPAQLEVKTKAILLAMTFLIDYVYFSGNKMVQNEVISACL